MDAVDRIKPPLGAQPFHSMEPVRQFCELCGLSAVEILEKDEVFCSAILRANKAMQDQWYRVMREAKE